MNIYLEGEFNRPAKKGPNDKSTPPAFEKHHH
jgi:hypothetical protein